jgi:deoxyribonuclease V
MKIHHLHSWDLTPSEAIALQKQLAGQVDGRSPLRHCAIIAGADVSYNRFDTTFFASVVVCRLEDGSVIEKQSAVGKVTFPYVPGLLSFRETPIVLDALAKVTTEPDAVMLECHGYSHPRRFGLACHIGFWLDKPTLGCAKTRLCGQYKEPKRKAGSVTPLLDKGEVIGEVVRTKDGVKPVFVSVGHRIDLASAVRIALATCRGYRLPEPTRQAHQHANALRRQYSSPPADGDLLDS